MSVSRNVWEQEAKARKFVIDCVEKGDIINRLLDSQPEDFFGAVVVTYLTSYCRHSGEDSAKIGAKTIADYADRAKKLTIEKGMAIAVRESRCGGHAPTLFISCLDFGFGWSEDEVTVKAKECRVPCSHDEGAGRNGTTRFVREICLVHDVDVPDWPSD